jgi:putative addiction module component (TIGR02574 family)
VSKSADESAEAVYQAALKLSDEERELLLLKLTVPVSRDELATPEFHAAWAEECDRRYQDWQAGKLKAVPGDLVMQRLRQRLTK